MSDKTVIKIEFDNPTVAHYFAVWLCELGEQDYWNWMKGLERKKAGDITAVIFSYHGKEDESKSIDDPARYETFMSDNTIRTVAGRLDKDEDE